MKRRVGLIILSVIAMLLASGTAIALLLWNGIILINEPSETEYPVRGVDVSAYQGDIDWEILASQNIDFAYIKATEGSSHTDRYFADNYAEATKTHLRIGAYHFFSFESGGDTQAAHFIATVPKTENMLPPVIDLEFYGDFADSPPSKEYVTAELDKMISAIYAHYGMYPVIYTAEEEYSLYLSGNYAENAIWIRGVYGKPSLSDGRTWTFWQYTNRERLDGYNGEELFIDMNVFNGSKEDFENFGK